MPTCGACRRRRLKRASAKTWRPKRGRTPFSAMPGEKGVRPLFYQQNRGTLGILDRIKSKQARIGVIGLGYVGLPLATEFARVGFDVTGFDVDEAKVADINAGRSYIPDVSSPDLAAVVTAGRMH